MADYSFISNQAQNNPVNQMAGIVNMANGIQQFQAGNIELQKARQMNQDRIALQQFTSNPDNWQTDGNIDMDKINKAVPVLAPLAGPAYISSMADLSKSQTAVNQAKLGLSTDERKLYDAAISAPALSNSQNKADYITAINNAMQRYPENKAIQRMGIADLQMMNNLPNQSPDFAKAFWTRTQGNMPASEQTNAILASQGLTTDQEGNIVSTKKAITPFGGQKVTSPFAGAGGTGKPEEPSANNPRGLPIVDNIPLAHPVRSGTQPFAQDLGEQIDKQAGTQYRNNLVGQQSALSGANQFLQLSYDKASDIAKRYGPTSGYWANVQKVGAQIMGDPSYQQLSKDLANTQIAQLKAAGGDMQSDAGKKLVALANGEDTYSPDVLKSIITQNLAQNKALDMQANAAQKFYSHFGDNNMNTFKQVWNKNITLNGRPDNRIFQAMTIGDSNLPPEEKKAEIVRIFNGDGKLIQQALQQGKKLKTLEQTGTIQ